MNEVAGIVGNEEQAQGVEYWEILSTLHLELRISEHMVEA